MADIHSIHKNKSKLGAKVTELWFLSEFKNDFVENLQPNTFEEPSSLSPIFIMLEV